MERPGRKLKSRDVVTKRWDASENARLPVSGATLGVAVVMAAV